MTWYFKLLEQMSPQIVAALQEGLAKLLQTLLEKARETDNKWDDWAVEMIAKILGVDLEIE